MVVWSKMLEFVLSFLGGELLKQLPDFILVTEFISRSRRNRLDPTILFSPLCNQPPRFVILMKRLDFEIMNHPSHIVIHPKVISLTGKQLRFNTTSYLNRKIHKVMLPWLANIGNRMPIPKSSNEICAIPNRR